MAPDLVDRQLLRALERIGTALVVCATALAILTVSYCVVHA